MHYYGTYALARLAGIGPDSARIIATAAQYVDDSVVAEMANEKGETPLAELAADGNLAPEVTAHHLLDLVANTRPRDQRFIWLPFHFLPGNEGEQFPERLVCVKGSRLAQDMVDHHLEQADRPFSRELMGIAAHVYEDTFSHYGFVGISSRRNLIKGGEFQFETASPNMIPFLNKKKERFSTKFDLFGRLLEKIKQGLVSHVGEEASRALGHAAAATIPDQPFVRWRFEYERGDLFPGRAKRDGNRNNQQDFLEACRRIHEMLRRFAARRPDLADPAGGKEFDQVAEVISGILAVEADEETRIEAWQKALMDGQLYAPVEGTIPTYDYKDWHQQRKSLGESRDWAAAPTSPVYRFYQAASLHRHYVLRELLPSVGLVVV